jgi:hypothetical protein
MELFLFIFHCLIIGSLAFLVWRHTRQNIFWPALLIKLLAGIALGLLYMFYYASGDTWIFFNDGAKVADAIAQSPKSVIDFFWNDDWTGLKGILDSDRPRSLFFVKWVAVFNLLDGNNYWITSLYFSFISFLSSWILFESLSKFLPGNKVEVAISILFIPSIVFWGSGTIKESLAIAALFGVTAYFISWHCNGKLPMLSFAAALVALWVLWSLKYYWAAVWLAVVIPVVVVQILRKRVGRVNRNPKFSWIVLLFLALGFVSIIHPNFYYDNFLLVIVENHVAYLKLSNPEDAIHFKSLEPSIVSMMLNSPWALLSGLFRPFIFEAGNILQVAAGLENLVLFVLFAFTMVRIQKQWPQLNELRLALVVYIGLLAIFLAMSTPNFGSLARYRVGFTPFLWLLLLAGSGVLKWFKRSWR